VMPARYLFKTVADGLQECLLAVSILPVGVNSITACDACRASTIERSELK
jgi:hypothetical protein